MTLTLKIEYHTVWGQDLFLALGNELIPMICTPGGIWEVSLPSLEQGRRLEYRYEVHSGGFCLRREWLAHTLTVGESDMEVRDSWTDVPEDQPLRSAPFLDGAWSAASQEAPSHQGKRPWKAAGTVIPVFSLRTEQSFGIGEFNDLKLLVDWACLTGQKIIQVLPVNDTSIDGTWRDSYPYNANSCFALHPQFIHLPDLGVEENEDYCRLRDELNSLPAIDYERVNRAKHRLLRLAYEKNAEETLSSPGYRKFVSDNAFWLIPYAVFCVLRDDFRTPDFTAWGEFSDYDSSKAEKFMASRKKDTLYWCYVQYHLHLQLLQARDYARSKGVVFKGDLPIGVSRTSADAWVDRRLFNMDSQAGAPPDAFSDKGQNWGFPTYDWEEMSKDGYRWWKNRLHCLSQYFDAFRIDHILGFFRIWEIPSKFSDGLKGHFSPALPYAEEELGELGFDRQLREALFVEDPRQKGRWHPAISANALAEYKAMGKSLQETFDSLHHDFFYRRHNAFWKESAMRKLPDLLTATSMLACGEDLGMIPDCVPEVMTEYRILSLEIQRMPKTPGSRFADPSHYPYYSVCSTSTHDMSTIREWWEEDREAAECFWKEVLGESGEAPKTCEPWICRRMLEMSLGAESMLAILPLQDWLSMDRTVRRENPGEERINVPSDSRHYWRYRMHLTLESLIGQRDFNSAVSQMLRRSGRIE